MDRQTWILLDDPRQQPRSAAIDGPRGRSCRIWVAEIDDRESCVYCARPRAEHPA
jgi:hypothetical protein